MLAVVLVGALIAQSAMGAPSRCTEFCDEPSTGASGAITGRGANGGYSSYSRYGSHSSWSSGTGNIGSRSGGLESLDENGIAGGAVGGLERPGTWEDKKHYVTDDGRGEMSYRAGQTVTNNGFSKFAQHSYRYGTHDNHQPKPDSQILTTAEFENEFQSMRQRISNFMSNFRLDAGSAVNANFLQDFTAKANLMTSQMNNVCNQVEAGSQMYQQMQSMIEQFRRDVEQRQREIETAVYQTTSSGSGSSNTNVNAEWNTGYPAAQPSPQVQYPTRPSVNMEVVVTQQLEQELNVVHNMVAKFAGQFTQPENTPQYLSNLDAEINVINQKITELSSQALQHESVRARYEQLKTYFESCVASIRARIEEIDRRNREIEERRLQREQELRIEAERKAEERRLEQIRIQEEKDRIQREQHLAQQREQQQLLLQQQQQLQLQQLQQQQQQLQQEQQLQQQQHYQPTQTYPHTSGSSVQVSGSIEHSYTGTYGAQIHGSSGGSTSGGYTQGGVYQRPQSSSAPEVDIIAATNRLQQDLNRLQNEVNRFNSYSMRLTSSNSASIVSEAESAAANLQNRINSLCESSNRYQNNDIYNHAEQLRQRLQGYLQSFKSQAASYSAQYNAQYSQSGQFAASGGYQSSARYGSVQPPKVSNVEYEHQRSTDVEITGRNLGEGRNSYARLGRSVGEDYGPYFDSNQETLDYGQQHQPLLDQDYTYGRVDEIDSYNNPYGYNLRNPKIPENFEDYSQHTNPVELTRDYQRVRTANLRQGAGRHQSQRVHTAHQLEDLTYQPGALDDYYVRQYSQDPLSDPHLENESDSTQQHVSYGESEDLERLERPRSQKVDSEKNFRDKSLDSDDLQREENRRQQINHLSPENPNGKPRITSSFGKFEFAQSNKELTLEKSGFNDYSSTLTTQQVQPIIDNSRLEQETEEPPRVRPLLVHQKFEYAEKTENLTLEQSGFYDYQKSSEKPKTAEYPEVTTVKTLGKVGSALEVEDLNLENSGFNDYSSQTRNKKLNDKPKRILLPLATNFEINQQNEKYDLQQSGFGSFESQNEKLETFDETDLTQQTAGQINFGAESQSGRQFTSYATPKPGKLDGQQHLKPNFQNLELGQIREHPVGQYIENLSQQEQSSLSVESSNYTHRQSKVDDQNSKISTTSRYTHDLLPTVRPTVKPAPKPIPRYTRPWQVSQINNVPKPNIEAQEKQFQKDNTKIEESINLQNLDKHSESLRGDLPGVSETSTVPVPVTTVKLENNQQANSEYESGQQFEQVNLNVNSQLDDLQKSRNDWVQNNGDNQSGQTNYFRQESIQHKYEHSQQSSIYFSQQNSGQGINLSNNQPILGKDSNDQQVYQPIFREDTDQQQESLPRQLESERLGSIGQENFKQQVQTPSFEEQSNQFVQNPKGGQEEEYAERVIPLEETKTISDLSEAETTTAPPSFWKRVGHKLSNSFDKAKEKARNIFG